MVLGAVDPVIPQIAKQGILALATDQRIPACPAAQLIIVMVSQEGIIARLTAQIIIAVVAT